MSYAYTYLSDGGCRSKTVSGVTTIYHYNNGLLLSMITGDEILYFYYDSTGKVASIGYKKGSVDDIKYLGAAVTITEGVLVCGKNI